jgi:4-amino-4-deoxy-L-arabinose transferase-like glycosyltransferase
MVIWSYERIKSLKTTIWFFIIAVWIRLIFFTLNYNILTQIPTATDSFGYYERATNLSVYQTYTFPEKDHEVAFWTPGYPFLMFVLFKIFGIKISAVLLVQILIGSASLTLLYLLIRQNISHVYEKYIKILLLLFPDFILYDVQMLTQCLFNTVLLIVFYLLYNHKWKQYKYALIAGFALGYAILIKSVATFILFLLTIYIILYAKKYWKQGLILIFTTVLCVLPWSIRNYALTGKFVWVHTNTQWNFYLGNHQQSAGAYGGKSSYLYDHTFLEGYTELEREKICKARAWAFIKRHPFEALKNNLLKISRTFSPRGAWALYQTGNSKTGVDFSVYNTIPNNTFIQWYSLPFLFLVQMFGILGVFAAIQNIQKHYWILMPYFAFLGTFFFFVTGTNYVYLALPYLVYLAVLGFVNFKKNLVLTAISGILVIINWIFQYNTYVC